MKKQFAIFTLFCLVFFSCTKENTTPTSVKITKIELISYPLNRTGGGDWDGVSGGAATVLPDPFITINQGVTTHTGAFYSTYLSDATGSIISYSINFPYTITSPTTDWAFGVWDYDGSLSASENMNGLVCKFSDYAASQPATITLTAGTITMKLYVEWSF